MCVLLILHDKGLFSDMKTYYAQNIGSVAYMTGVWNWGLEVGCSGGGSIGGFFYFIFLAQLTILI